MTHDAGGQDMSLRDKISNVRYMGTTVGYGVADAIIAALPDMIEPLVWEGFISGPYEITVRDNGTADLLCHAIHDEDWNPDYIKGGYLTLVSIDDLKAAANTHHRAQVMAAFSIPQT